MAQQYVPSYLTPGADGFDHLPPHLEALQVGRVVDPHTGVPLEIQVQVAPEVGGQVLELLLV